MIATSGIPKFGSQRGASQIRAEWPSEIIQSSWMTMRLVGGDWNIFFFFHIWGLGLEHVFFFHILGIVIPTDFHTFQRVFLQPPIRWVSLGKSHDDLWCPYATGNLQVVTKTLRISTRAASFESFKWLQAVDKTCSKKITQQKPSKHFGIPKFETTGFPYCWAKTTTWSTKNGLVSTKPWSFMYIDCLMCLVV